MNVCKLASLYNLNQGGGIHTYTVDVYLVCGVFQMRWTKKVSVWPVGLSGGLKFEGPFCENGVPKFQGSSHALIWPVHVYIQYNLKEVTLTDNC